MNALEILQQSVSFSQGFILSVLPRGSLQIVQPAKTPETMLKAYAKDFQREDRVAWQAILTGKPVRGSDAWTRDEFESSVFYLQYLQPHGLRHVAAAPLTAPVLGGYPGVAYLCRGPDEPDFSDADLAGLEKAARQLDGSMVDALRSRRQELGVDDTAWSHRTPGRFWVYSGDGQPLFPKESFGLDERLDTQIRQRVKLAVDQSKRGHLLADRVLLPDAWGDLWVFRAVFYRDYPALGKGPVVFVSLQPEAVEWVGVRSGDVAADPELVRLLPTLRYMQHDFNQNPTLNDIAKKAHLSPFHFHRRFSDLIGQTPKHFLLSCQITQAKRMLVARKRELAQIATDCGFAHQSHFTSRFKQATGLTPTRWRRMAAQVTGGAGGTESGNGDE